MPKVNVYLPDDLAAAVREAGIPVSTVCQRALEDALRQATALREGDSGTSSGTPGTVLAGIQLPQRATGRLTRAVELAVEEARRRKHGFVGTEHLLLGMLLEGENLAVRVITTLDVTPGDLRAELEATMQQALDGAPGGEPDFTPAARRALELTAKEATQLRHNYLGCEHLLLALIRGPEGLAGRVLRTMGFDVAVTRRAVRAALSGFVHARVNAHGDVADVAGFEHLLGDIAARLARLESRLGSG